MTVDLLARARAGDGDAFRRLTEPYLRELQVHCYRMLGSVQDAEDALQETLVAAWRGLGRFEGRASVRTWLYRVATNHCLNALRATKRRPAMDVALPDVEIPEPTRLGEVTWLEPYPDVLLAGGVSPPPGPDARYEASESISLAFVTALQVLPPRQRTVLILRDVLGYRAAEVAGMLEASLASVNNALKRARATLETRIGTSPDAAPSPGSPVERELAERLARAYETGDVDGVVALLADDVWIAMPPLPLEYHGQDLAARFHASVAFRGGQRWQLIATRANGQPAFGAYIRDPNGGPSHVMGLLVLTLAGEQISRITMFDKSTLAHFGFPRTLPG